MVYLILTHFFPYVNVLYVASIKNQENRIKLIVCFTLPIMHLTPTIAVVDTVTF